MSGSSGAQAWLAAHKPEAALAGLVAAYALYRRSKGSSAAPPATSVANTTGTDTYNALQSELDQILAAVQASDAAASVGASSPVPGSAPTGAGSGGTSSFPDPPPPSPSPAPTGGTAAVFNVPGYPALPDQLPAGTPLPASAVAAGVPNQALNVAPTGTGGWRYQDPATTAPGASSGGVAVPGDAVPIVVNGVQVGWQSGFTSYPLHPVEYGTAPTGAPAAPASNPSQAQILAGLKGLFGG